MYDFMILAVSILIFCYTFWYFQTLGVDPKDVTPVSLLKDRVRQVEVHPDLKSNQVQYLP